MERDRRSTVGLTEDSFAALVTAYKQSPKFKAYAYETRALWGRELEHAAKPKCLGPVSLQELRPSVVQAFFDGLTGLPGKQQAALAAIRQMEKWAIVRDLLPREITKGVEIEHSDGGHVPWTDAYVELGERAARADFRRIITLAANTGQRGSDLVRMCPTDLETYNGIDGINVTQIKTGKQVWIPITSPLAEAMKGWERQPGPFLRMLDGRPWPRQSMTKAWTYERDHNRALEELKRAGLVLHGLRGTACVRLRRAGATIPQIADMVGMSEEMVGRYCRLSIQKENAMAAVYHLERNIRERNSDTSNKKKPASI